MLHQHGSNLIDIAQEKSRVNTEQKDKIVRNITRYYCTWNKFYYKYIFIEGFWMTSNSSRLEDIWQKLREKGI